MTWYKKLTAKRDDVCSGCGGEIHAGERIGWNRTEGAFHDSCTPSADKKGDREYWQGRRDADNYRENRRLFGDEVADAMEIERELREGWDY